MNHDHYLEAIGDYVEQQLATMWNAWKIMRNRTPPPHAQKGKFFSFVTDLFYTKNRN